MRTPFIAGNWKMHKTVGEAEALIAELRPAFGAGGRRVLVAPPFTALERAVAATKGSAIEVGAQNMAAERSGAHTGEVSVLMLKDLGVEVVILGHSERRAIYGETDATVNTKVRLALEEGLEVILCIGETLDERDAGRAEDVVRAQVTAGLDGVGAAELTRVTLAYEPVWAIGTGRTATPDDANAIHRMIRATIADRYGAEAAEQLIIQYGGSVKPGNVAALMAQPDIDGALVGGASLTADTFIPIVNFDV